MTSPQQSIQQITDDINIKDELKEAIFKSFHNQNGSSDVKTWKKSQNLLTLAWEMKDIVSDQDTGNKGDGDHRSQFSSLKKAPIFGSWEM